MRCGPRATLVAGYKRHHFLAAFSLPQNGDDVSHFAKQGAGQAFRLHYMAVRSAGLAHVAGDLELQPERGQLVAPSIVQLARDAQALRIPNIVGDDGLRGAQLSVRPGQESRRFRLPSQRLRGENGAQLQHHGQGNDIGQMSIRSLRNRADNGERLEGDPAQRSHGSGRHRNLPRDDDEE